MKATVIEDAAGLRFEIKDDGSEDYRKAVELTCCKPAAWMVKAPIGSILPLCHSRREAEDVAEKLTSESRIVPLYEYDEWNEIKKAGELASREEGFKVMEAEITALHAEVERLTAAWIPVGERLPEGDEPGAVLGWNGIHVREVVFCPRCKEGEQWSSFGGHEYVTHWMPLPEPPAS